MHHLILILALLFGFAAGLYMAWRGNYRYPPESPPQVLCFHKVSRRFCWEGTWTTPRRFFATVDRLRDRGYQFIGESDYLSSLDSPAPHDGKRLFLTFDDGYSAVRTEVFEGMVARSLPFHVFLLTDYVGKENSWDLSLGRRPVRHASWNEIREMAAAGVTFGSHTASHRDLTRLDDATIAGELTHSKQAIEYELGAPARTVSYPFGRYDARVIRAARAARYAAAFSLYPRRPNEDIDRYALRRNGVYIIDPARLVEMKLRPNPLYWLEEMKCRTINAVSVITPLLKRR